MAIKTGVDNTAQNVEFMPTALNIKIFKGDSINASFVLLDDNGGALNLSGWSGAAAIRDSSNNVVAQPTVIFDEESEEVRIFVADTSNLPVGNYDYTVQLTDPQGRKRTYLAGVVTVSVLVQK